MVIIIIIINADPVSQSLVVVSGALLQWALSSQATGGTATKEQNNQQNTKSTNEVQLFLETRNGNIRSKFTATEQLKADHSLTVKATKPQNTVEHRGKSKKGFDKRGNKGSDMVLYVLQTAF